MKKQEIIRTTVRMPVDIHQQMTEFIAARRYTPDKTSVDRLIQEAVVEYVSRRTKKVGKASA